MSADDETKNPPFLISSTSSITTP